VRNAREFLIKADLATSKAAMGTSGWGYIGHETHFCRRHYRTRTEVGKSCWGATTVAGPPSKSSSGTTVIPGPKVFETMYNHSVLGLWQVGQGSGAHPGRRADLQFEPAVTPRQASKARQKPNFCLVCPIAWTPPIERLIQHNIKPFYTDRYWSLKGHSCHPRFADRQY
jgi:hypothetical protein